MGRVVEVHPGKDGVILVLSLRIKAGVIKRPLVKLALLQGSPVSFDGAHQFGEDVQIDRMSISSRMSTIVVTLKILMRQRRGCDAQMVYLVQCWTCGRSRKVMMFGGLAGPVVGGDGAVAKAGHVKQFRHCVFRSRN
ncbi:hypothetical protein LAZ67_18000999 [Cordylochernes scorpioides]|uniref:DUF5641 domain-containing protein n=1 Tax=Cordylochernes scorpioides TaxID=51811 RepID=A0ABY6LGT8_9ARAC|nr:hypothetical protein LAZ67_18000999 [Cordylochernes scorpioides]